MERILTIESLAFGGEGVGRDDGKVVFVPQAVPGDHVRVRVVSDHGKYERAEILEIVAKSPDRVDPECPVFGSCGGCQWQQVRYDAQLKWKREILSDSLRRVGRIPNPDVLPIIPAADPWHYRRRIQLKVDGEGRIGFYGPKSHGVVEFDECRIADPLLNERLAEMRRVDRAPQKGFELSLNGTAVVHVLEEKKSDLVFSQVNPAQNKHLVQTVLDFAFGNADMAFTKQKRIVELYAGRGNFSFPLARKAGGITCVEENAQAVRLAEEEAESRGLDHMTWIQGSAEWGLKKVYRNREAVDILVMDPPRRGAKEILDLVCVIKPRFIVYVSCDPVTLARDLCQLVRRHYTLEKVQPVDMFPQTYHVESVSKLVLRNDSSIGD